MSSLFEDSRTRYTREGRREGELDRVIRISTKLVHENIMNLEQALEFMDIPEGYEEYIRTEVVKNLSSQD